MKKIIALLLAVVLCLSLVACGSSTTATETTTTETTTTETATTETTTETTAEMTAEEKEAAREEIRQAISLLFDRNYIVNDIAQGGQVPASSFVAMGMTNPDGTQFYQTAGDSDSYYGYYDVSEEAYEDNFTQAVEILKKYYTYDETTGKFTNFPTLTYLYNTSEGHKAIGEYLQAALASVGITMNLENQEWNTFLNTRKDGDTALPATAGLPTTTILSASWICGPLPPATTISSSARATTQPLLSTTWI